MAPVERVAAAAATGTCTLWAPACTVELFNEFYLPAMKRRDIGRFATFVLSDQTEQEDNCARVYNKSLLYLMSNAFEGKGRIPFCRDREGVPILGMERSHDATLRAAFQDTGGELVVAPNAEPLNSTRASSAMHHGDFDDDERTVMGTFRRMVADAGVAPATAARAGAMPPIKNRSKSKQPIPAEKTTTPRMFNRSQASLQNQRQQIDAKTR